jgi:hypothetical protein
MDRLLEWVLVRLGAPKGESPRLYRDLALAFPFVFGSLIAGSLAFEGKFSIIFWVCLGASGIALVFATRRGVLLGGLCLFAAIRFVVAFVFTRQGSMLLAAGLCAVVAYGIAASDKSDSSEPY